MTIQPSDIALYFAERRTDEDTGGGRPSGDLVPDNTTNALFAKTSRLDRTEGRFNMSKVFCAVRTAGTDVYQGSHFAITKDAADQYVNILAMAGTPTDTRAEARARIEAYLAKGVDARLWLLGDQFAGQRTVLMYQELTAPMPDLGATLYLNQLDEDGQVEAEEYIKIGKMDMAVQTFTYLHNSEFKTIDRRVLTIKLTAKLKTNFRGGTPYPTGTQRDDDAAAARVYNTNITGNATYCGVTALAVAAQAGDSTLRAAEVFKPIVPTAYSENIITERQPWTELAQITQTGTGRADSLTFAAVAGNQSRAFLPRIPMRGMTMTIDGGVYKEQGDGAFKFLSGTDNYSQITVSFESGQIDAYRKTGVFTGTATANWVPAARLMGAAISFGTEVNQTNRTLSWVWDLANAVPEPGSLVIYYRSLSKWQFMSDNGTGQLTGAGTGSISAGGTVSATFTTLPDAESVIVLAYLPSGSMESTRLDGQHLSVAKRQAFSTGYAIKMGSLTVAWVSGGQAKQVTDDGAGSFTGDLVAGSGAIGYAGRWFEFIPTALPDDGTYQLQYTRGPNVLATVTIPTLAVTPASFDAGGALVPGTVAISYQVQRRTGGGFTRTSRVTITDDGAGNLLRDGATVGSVDYETGVGSFGWSLNYYYDTKAWQYAAFGMVYDVERIYADETQVGDGTLTGVPTGEVDATLESLTVNIPSLQFSLGVDDLAPGSLMFTDNGHTYIDRDGVLWKDPASQTGAGTRVGTVAYDDATITLFDPKGMTGDVTILAGLSMQAAPYITRAFFRTPGSPIKSASLTLRATDATGHLLQASLHGDGTITGDLVKTGQADISSGLATVEFSAPVAAASLVYSTIILTSLPLSSEAIGLDPVRLPPDGKVPIFADGVGVIVGHTATADLGTPVASQQVDCGRDYLAEIWVTDSAGTKLAADQYTEDRDAGLVTFNADLALVAENGAALAPPLTLHHRIEHRSLLQDVQPNGDLTLAIPLAQDFPAGESFVSSYLRQGDRWASWDHLFVQASWDTSNPNWGHSPVGSELLADYNAIDYPPEVNNDGAVDDEWLLRFTSASTFDVFSRDRGKLGAGNITTDLVLNNPNTGTPYFILRAAGWGTGWVSGNVLRLTTISALAPVWLLRCISIGPATHPDDEFQFMQYGDAA